MALKDNDGNEITSCETFGDSTDRHVHFDRDLSSLSGKPVVLTIKMKDADLYAIRFLNA